MRPPTDRRCIVVVEDEPKIASVVHDFLVRDGYLVELLCSGDEAVARIIRRQPALVVLDRMLPGVDGLAICRELRARSNVPVIVLTARVDEEDLLEGFDAGADDYVCKPFNPAELVARVRSVLRRTEPTANTIDEKPDIAYGQIRLDTTRRSCTVGQASVELTGVEYRLLLRLLETPGRYHSRYQLMRAIYEDHRVVSDRTIDSHVKNLRRKLANGSNESGEFIRSRYGLGYGIA